MAATRVLSKTEVDRFDHLPELLSTRVRLRTSRLLPPQASAMTIGRTVLIRPGHEGDETLLAHELVHVRQWSDLGPVRFLIQYLGAYFRNLVRLRSHRAAYRAIPLEQEARTGAATWRAAHQ